MIVITGGAGFIGSALVAKLNAAGINDIIIVDDLGCTQKWKNLRNKTFLDFIHKDKFISQLDDAKFGVPKAIIHMGACSSTTEKDCDYLIENNFHYSQNLAQYAVQQKIRFIYASSAATYGDGALGYSESIDTIPKLRPLNPYGFSKQLFDLWVLKNGYHKRLVGLKFFNVFGPNEYHKENQVSVVHSAFRQIVESGKVRLFKSHRDDCSHGEQKRDFVYVKDCCAIMHWLIQNPKVNGIFNVGSGKARSFNDLVKATFLAMGKPMQIEYIDMPESLRYQYQYFTQADLEGLAASGYSGTSTSLEDGIKEYVQNYLARDFEIW